MIKTEIKNVKVHSCFKQRNFAAVQPIGVNSLKCRCRFYVDAKEAKELIETGRAMPVVAEWKRTETKKACEFCLPETRKSCQVCKSTGLMTVEGKEPRFTSLEVVYSSEITDEKGRQTVRSEVAKKTPRVATVEKTHIERAYVKGDPEEQERIEEYGVSQVEALAFVGKDKTYVIGVEPEDDLSTSTGRTYDWGKAIFVSVDDERTEGGVGLDLDVESEKDLLTIVDDPNQSLVDEKAEETNGRNYDKRLR